MASMASQTVYRHLKFNRKQHDVATKPPRITLSHQNNLDNGVEDDKVPQQLVRSTRRDIVLRSSELALVGAIFNFSGKKPDYLGVQKSQQTLALCPATKNCISTSENIADITHYTPPWNYNSGRKKPVSREVAMEELIQVIKSTKPDKFAPKIVEKKDDYVRVEYQSPILGLVDDVEFWFPPGKDSIVEYRSASRIGTFDFDYNRKRIKLLREELEKRGWASQDSF